MTSKIVAFAMLSLLEEPVHTTQTPQQRSGDSHHGLLESTTKAPSHLQAPPTMNSAPMNSYLRNHFLCLFACYDEGYSIVAEMSTSIQLTFQLD